MHQEEIYDKASSAEPSSAEPSSAEPSLWHQLEEHSPFDEEESKVFLTGKQETILAYMAELNSYWKKASDFYFSIKGRWLFSLSVNQRDWYFSIIGKVYREEDRYEAAIAFGLKYEPLANRGIVNNNSRITHSTGSSDSISNNNMHINNIRSNSSNTKSNNNGRSFWRE